MAPVMPHRMRMLMRIPFSSPRRGAMPARTGLGRYVAAGLLALAPLACTDRQHGGASGVTGGTMVVSSAADVDYLFPPLVTTTQGREVTELLFDHLAEVGDSLNVIGDQGFVPHLAQRWQWAHDSLSVAFYLNPKARWHDGTPVRASDVKFTYKLYSDTAVSGLSSLTDNIDSVTVRDSLTVVYWFKRRSATSFYDATMQMLIMPEHVYGTIPATQLKTSEVIRHPVGSGRFRFVRWIPNTTIEIVSDTANYRGRASLDRVIWSIAPDFNTAVTKLLAGEADFFEAMRPENVAQAAKSSTVRVRMFPSFDYGFMLFNLRDPKHHANPHPLFGDRMLRRALTMAVDRRAVVQNVFDSLAVPALGPMVRAMPTTDTSVTEIPYDVNGAMRLLDSLGWKDNGSGFRFKHGTPLAFTLTFPSVAKSRERSATLLQDQLKKVGVNVTLQPMELQAFIRMENSRDFDAVMHLWHLDASPSSILQVWGTQAAGPDGANYGSYTSATFDAEVDSAVNASTLDRARPLYKRAYQTMIDDAPAIWIYEPRTVIGIHARIQPSTIRADAWWSNLADWSIPANARIARDRIPVSASH